MSRTKVSNLVRVKQGKSTIEFELKDDKLTVALWREEDTRSLSTVTINAEAVNVLREMLGLQKAGVALALEPKLATALPPGSEMTEEARREAEHTSPDLEGDGDTAEGMA